MAWQLTSEIDGVQTIQTFATQAQAEVALFHVYNNEMNNVRQSAMVKIEDVGSAVGLSAEEKQEIEELRTKYDNEDIWDTI